jgi:FkbM family methyltransferase
MNSAIKTVLKSAIRAMVWFGGSNRLGRYFFNQIVESSMSRVCVVHHGGVELQFVAPNPLCEWRAKTFSSKEPETLEWIDAIPRGSVIWDIGANIGLYAIYAAKKRGCQVYAFEPSVFNLELLARNAYINGIADRICIIPVPLSEKLGGSKMRMTTTEWGGALSTFDKNFGWNGKQIEQVFEYQTIGLSIKDSVDLLGIPKPEYIKMDVDGIEHYILQGGMEVLSAVRGILLEVNDAFVEQAESCQKLLTEAGLVMVEKRHSEIIASPTSEFRHCYDQIWSRP